MRDIKYKTTSCGPAGSFQPDDVRYGVGDKEAEGLVSGGFAEYVDAPRPAPVREQAAIAPVEHAVSPAQPESGKAGIPARPFASPRRSR